MNGRFQHLDDVLLVFDLNDQLGTQLKGSTRAPRRASESTRRPRNWLPDAMVRRILEMRKQRNGNKRKSYRAIARELNVSQDTVRSICTGRRRRRRDK